MHFAFPLALFCTRSIHGVSKDYWEARRPAKRGSDRVMLSAGDGRLAKKDLHEWKRLGKGRRVLAQQQTQYTMQTDVAELG